MSSFSPARPSSAPSRAAILRPLATFAALLALWFLAANRGWLVKPTSEGMGIELFPSPQEVAAGFREQLASGGLWRDTIASVFRVLAGYVISVALGLPLGIWLGLKIGPRQALLPLLNFLRALSPLAWIPFSIFWFGLGHPAVIFLIVIAAVTPIALATMAAVANVPRIHFRVARDYGLSGPALLTQVTLPAILPQTITTLRVAMGLCWLVMVAGEMLAGNTGLGYLIHDANNGLRLDLIVVAMIAIGMLGIACDRSLTWLSRIRSVRWGYER